MKEQISNGSDMKKKQISPKDLIYDNLYREEMS